MSRVHRSVRRGDLMFVLECLEAHQEALELAESLLLHGLVASTQQFYGWRQDDDLVIHPMPQRTEVANSHPVGTGSIARVSKVREGL